MTPAQLRLLQQSFGRIEPHADRFGAIFYDRLFAIAPHVRPLFRTDLKAQQSKFMKVIAEVVQLHLRAMISLPATRQDSGEAMLPGAYWSGKLHAAYGVRVEDFAVMKQALMRALDDVLADEVTPEIRETWSLAYDIVARAMLRGMENAGDDDPEPEVEMRNRLADDDDDEEDEAGRDREATAFLKMLGKRS